MVADVFWELCWVGGNNDNDDDDEDAEEDAGICSCPNPGCHYPVDGTSMVIWYELESDRPPVEQRRDGSAAPFEVDLDQVLSLFKRNNRMVLEKGGIGRKFQRGERMCLRVVEEVEQKKLSYEELEDLVLILKLEAKRFEDHATAHSRELSGKVWRFERFAHDMMMGMNEIMH